ncbi:MAG: hypothetical protein RLZZ15_1302 [Verrucomicrobiota bacterium]
MKAPLLRRALACCAFALALGAAGALRAQETWTAVTAPTTRNLWGVCFGGGQFIAVGEGGTIISSPDGTTWTTRASGTPVWLTSVTYAFGQFVTLGEGGYVITSRDGVTWGNVVDLRSASLLPRLNVVRFDGRSFLAYGERGATLRYTPPAQPETRGRSDPGLWLRGLAFGLGRTVVGGEAGLSVFDANDAFLAGDRRTALLPTGAWAVSGIVFERDEFVAVAGGGTILSSTDAATWTPQTSGTTADLQDVAAFNNTLIAVGTGGTILSRDERGAWRRRTAPTSELLLGVAGGDGVAVAVGGSGTILRTVAKAVPPVIVAEPASVSETLDGAAAFIVRANGSSPLSYQWRRNGLPLAGETRTALMLTPLTMADAGNYTVVVTNPAGAATSAAASLSLLPAPPGVADRVHPPRILALAADKTTVRIGEPITVRAAVTGSAALTYDWAGAPAGNNESLRTTEPALTFRFNSPGQRTTLQLIVRNPSGEATSAPIVFTVLPDPPVILGQSTNVRVQTGKRTTLQVQISPTTGPLIIQWWQDGHILTRPALVSGNELGRVTTGSAGTYTFTLTNALGATVTSAPIVVTVDDTSRFANLSTRAFVGPGEQVIIAGFAVAGVNQRQIMIRGVGPALAKFGVADALPDPRVELFEGTRARGSLAVGWDSGGPDDTSFFTAAFKSVGAFPFDAGSRDVVYFAAVPPGTYTVVLTSASGRTGTALVEIYEYDDEADRLLNLSSRALVDRGAPAIAGLAIQGLVPKRVLLRAVGPELAAFGVAGVLVNPRLMLKDAAANTVATNDDWETTATSGVGGAVGASAAELRAAAVAVNAFPLAAASRDAALLVTLAPGNYTLLAEGGATASGVVLVEAYEVP